MEKAYDPKDLVAKLKERGLDVAEEAAKVVIESVFDWLDESADASPTPYDNLLKALYPTIKAEALKAVDKIDGEVG